MSAVEQVAAMSAVSGLPPASEPSERELFEEMLASNAVEVRDRRYLLSEFAQCFVGRELVDWLCERTGASRHVAQRKGQSWMALGWIEHVAQEHDFADDYLFYRVTPQDGDFASVSDMMLDPGLGQFSLSALARQMRADGVALRDHRRWFVIYPSCFSGSELVDWLVRKHAVSRGSATTLGERMLQSNLIRHVLDEKAFEDGREFYRYV